MLKAEQGIYKIVNLINGKVYVGSSKNLYNRINRHHKNPLRNNKHHNRHLQRAWNKYGEQNFKFEIIEKVNDEKDLINREQYWMDLYDAANRACGYNIAPKADRSVISEETRKRQSEIRKGIAPLPPGWHHTEEAKRKIAEAGKRRKGIKLSDETKEKLRIINTGKKLSEKTKQKMRDNHKKGLYKSKNENMKGRKLSKETRRKMSLARMNKEQSSMKRMKCSISKMGKDNPNYINMPRAVANKIISLFNMGRTVASIAREVGYSQYKVKRFLVDNSFAEGKVTWVTSRWL